jgi:hypothetical protein
MPTLCAKSPSAKQTLLDLAQTWQNLALETEAIDTELRSQLRPHRQ